MAPLFIDQTEEPESNTTDGTELYEDSQLSSRSKAIASKTKEIEQVRMQSSGRHRSWFVPLCMCKYLHWINILVCLLFL